MFHQLRQSPLFKAVVPALTLLVIVAAAGIAATLALQHAGRMGRAWWPREYVPPIMLAAGHGFNDLSQGVSLPELDAFIERKSERFDVSLIPPNPPTGPTSPLARSHFYLMATIAGFWKLFGVSWFSFSLMLAVFFCITHVLIYGIFRLGMNRVFSVAATLLFMFAPIMLTSVPNPRDFCKAPFILAAILILGYLVKKHRGRGVFLGLALCYGLITGVGLGFRQDLRILLPVGLLILLVFAQGPLRLRVRVAAGVLMLAGFIGPAAPILIAARDMPGSTHHMIMGLAPICERNLGVSHASYFKLDSMLDGLAYSARVMYARNTEGRTGEVPYEKPEDEAVGKKYMLHVLRTFPADVLTRAYAATLRLLSDAPLNINSFYSREEPMPPLIRHAQRVWTPLGGHFDRFKFYYLAAAFVMAAVMQVRYAWVLLVLGCYFLGYPSLQFWSRHYFHLAFAPLWLAGFVFDKALVAVWMTAGAVLGKHPAGRLVQPRAWLRAAGNVAAFAIPAAALLFGPIYPARWYQEQQVDKLVEAYRNAPLEPVAYDQQSQADGRMLITPVLSDTLAQRMYRLIGPSAFSGATLQEGEDVPIPIIKTAINPLAWYYVAEFRPGATPMSILFKYTTNNYISDFTSCVTVSLPEGGRFIFPVYEYRDSSSWGTNSFKGMALMPDAAARLVRVYRITHPEKFPLMLEWALPDDPGDVITRLQLQLFTAPDNPRL